MESAPIQKNKKSKKWIWIIVLLAIIGIGFFINYKVVRDYFSCTNLDKNTEYYTYRSISINVSPDSSTDIYDIHNDKVGYCGGMTGGCWILFGNEFKSCDVK